MKGEDSESACIKQYLSTVGARNEATAKTYKQRLRRFEESVMPEKMDDVIKKLQKGKLDPYNVLAGFHSYMQKRKVVDRSQVHAIKTAKIFLEYNDIEISNQKFKRKVLLPRPVRKQKQPLSKKDVTAIIDACKGDLRLYTYVMFLAATGCRATEAILVRNQDLHLDDPIQPFVWIKGEHTKTRSDRIVYLTAEIVRQLKEWLDTKYRERRTQYDHDKDKTIYGKYRPEPTENDYVFYPMHHKGTKQPEPRSVYVYLDHAFQARMKIAKRAVKEDGLARHRVTFHSLRRFVKTEISNLGHADFSEHFIGHLGSEYYNTSDEKKIELFHKIEPYLTFLDISQLEARGADQQTRLDQMQEELRKERLERDKLYAQLYKAGVIKKE
ncbi:tyrosine-type recombinase/integrase [Candidatus Nitrososphaera sp. FF02]|uniref:tyrosine-type recombinase/integrase n=1 Tax=Candidatus Nitrososphaera sp. FF02 TaxID=3398226 RepID=UPI0039EADD0E